MLNPVPEVKQSVFFEGPLPDDGESVLLKVVFGHASFYRFACQDLGSFDVHEVVIRMPPKPNPWAFLEAHHVHTHIHALPHTRTRNTHT